MIHQSLAVSDSILLAEAPGAGPSPAGLAALAFLVLVLVFLIVLVVCLSLTAMLFIAVVKDSRRTLPMHQQFPPFHLPPRSAVTIPRVWLAASVVSLAFGIACFVSPKLWDGGISTLPFLLGKPATNDEIVWSAGLSMVLGIGVLVLAAIIAGMGSIAIAASRIARR